MVDIGPKYKILVAQAPNWWVLAAPPSGSHFINCNGGRCYMLFLTFDGYGGSTGCPHMVAITPRGVAGSDVTVNGLPLNYMDFFLQTDKTILLLLQRINLEHLYH